VESSESEESSGEDESSSEESSKEEEKPKKKAPPKKRTNTKKTKKKKKDPNQPKRPITAYMFFMKLKRAEFAAKYPDMKFIDLSKKMAAEWKSLDKEDKKPYDEENRKDKIRYEKEMKNYKKPDSSSSSDDSSEEKPRKRKPAKKRPKKDPNAPKRAVNAYMFFTKDKRDQVRAKYPDLTMVEVSKKLGAMWKLLEDPEKEIYQKMAQDDKLRWERETKLYVANGNDDDGDED